MPKWEVGKGYELPAHRKRFYVHAKQGSGLAVIRLGKGPHPNVVCVDQSDGWREITEFTDAEKLEIVKCLTKAP